MNRGLQEKFCTILILFFVMISITRLWAMEIKRNGHKEAVTSLCFSPDGKYFASSSFDGTVKVWQVETGELIMNMAPEPTQINYVDFSSDGRFIAWGSSDKTVQVWNLKRNEGKFTFRGHVAPVYMVKYFPDGETLASAAASTGEVNHPVMLWNTRMEKMVGDFSGFPYGARSVDISADGEKVAAGGYKEGRVRVFESKGKKELFEFFAHGSHVLDLEFSPDGRYLATASNDFMVRVWDLNRGARRRHNFKNPGVVSSISYSADGRWLAAGCYDQSIYIWDARWGKVSKTLEGHLANVEALDYSSDGKYLVTGDFNGVIRLWDTQAYECVYAVMP
ncbi:MAG: WD40 repeat domain-containing protein [Vulcanimicrobiota bacterium]